MTMAERTFWFTVRDRRFIGLKFRRQVSLGAFVADFVCVEAHLVVELDGGQHALEVDAVRTLAIGSLGFRIVRFWNNETRDSLPGVLEQLRRDIGECGGSTLTQPSPASGRGL